MADFFSNFVEGWQRITNSQDDPGTVYRYTPQQAIAASAPALVPLALPFAVADAARTQQTNGGTYGDFTAGLARIADGTGLYGGRNTWDMTPDQALSDALDKVIRRPLKAAAEGLLGFDPTLLVIGAAAVAAAIILKD